MEATTTELILDQLKDIRETQKTHGEKLYDIHGEVSGLKVRASIFGIIGGVIAALLSKFGLGH
jgi:hypothetical protein